MSVAIWAAWPTLVIAPVSRGLQGDRHPNRCVLPPEMFDIPRDSLEA